MLRCAEAWVRFYADPHSWRKMRFAQPRSWGKLRAVAVDVTVAAKKGSTVANTGAQMAGIGFFIFGNNDLKIFNCEETENSGTKRSAKSEEVIKIH